MARIVPRANAWSVPTIAAVTGVAVGTLGGLIGLGGAEFRLPILVAVFGYGVRQAVGLNLGISLVTVLAGVTSRLLLGHAGVNLSLVSGLGVPMAVGGMVGAYSGSWWLARVRDSTLHRTIRRLLLGIGALLLVEAMTPWASTGLPLTGVSRALLAVVCGSGIGVVSSLLGVAGGELTIPTLIFLFGVDVKPAGTLSLLISVPTVLVGLWRQRAGVMATEGDLGSLVVPMAVGSVVGASLGGLLVAVTVAGIVKVLLGLVLMASALRIFAPRERDTSLRTPPVRS
jgi:uncharacterized membrane protein YfcA